MKKVKIIYNPNSGRQIVQKNIPNLVQILEENNYTVNIFPTEKQLDATHAAYDACQERYHMIISVGGDGTVNEVVNGIMKSTYRPLLGIYPAGTVNDFANYLQIPRSIDEFAEILINENTIQADVGLAGDRYFLNVAAAGLLTDVAYKVSSEAKTVLGKFAYYLEGLRELPKQIFRPVTMRMNMDGSMIEKEILFFILANSPFVGGFKYIVPQANISDGKFDLLIVEKSQFRDVATIFFKVLRGNHTTHPNLRYIQVDSFSIECDEEIYVDLDGEQGGRLPMDFHIKKQAINLIVP